MELKAYDKFSVKKKTEYEVLPIQDGEYLVLAVGKYHGMSVNERDYFNTKPQDKATHILIVRLNGKLMYTIPFSQRLDEIKSLIKNGYITELK